MEYYANPQKRIEISAENRTFARHAIKTHFIEIGEDYIQLVRKYVLPLYQPGDILSISEKIIALCQRRIIYKSEMKLSAMARILSRFAMHSDAGIGVDSPWKMQFAIDHCGVPKILFAAVCAGIGKMVGKHGVFYDIVGQEITGLDGFYDHVFKCYGEYGIRIPADPCKVCDEIDTSLGIPCMIVDANDITRMILGKSSILKESDDLLLSIIRDNPAGQSDECTPFILIREITENKDAINGSSTKIASTRPGLHEI